MSNHRKPMQARSRKTYELLLGAAETLLEEVGVERISSNLIVQRAKLTSPAFYRYFDDKYAVIEALAERLMQRQNEALTRWVDRYRDAGYDVLVDHIEDLVREMDAITRQQPGAIWIMRALRAVPSLAHIRLASHRFVTDLMTDVYMPYLPGVSRDLVRRRTRLAVEIAYSVDEMLKEDTDVRDEVFEDLTFIFRALYYHPDLARSPPATAVAATPDSAARIDA
ncbi:TetR/AcrR family transcriptional regulator [Sphingomonas sp. TREG-RG-20F-R18-01]|uniref:TetR/AcrR family transcriptional regulator n=1 Tax=Sphingomonas sp. TREG-RG-20F-R18-01 TaxID=2914982 RepID=UPI001F58F3EF|nr:TetR/AcrR family transcriptional regulator [Sphingomonas sp. TREG-RG-20F-R18-01]